MEWTMEWKTEWNSECITAVAANLCNWCCSIQVELRGVSLGLFYLTSKVSWASSACFYIQAWYYIVLLQAHFLSYFCKARLSYKKQQSGFARLLLWNFRETIVMEFSWPTMWWQELVLDPQCLCFSLHMYISILPTSHNLSSSLNSSKRGPMHCTVASLRGIPN